MAFRACIKAEFGVKGDVTERECAIGSCLRPSWFSSACSASRSEQLRTSGAVCPADCLYPCVLFAQNMWPSLFYDFARIF